MRIVHLTGPTLGDGAARGTWQLHQALRRAGVDSRLIVQRGPAPDATVRTLDARLPSKMLQRLSARADRLPLLAAARRPDALFSLGLLGLSPFALDGVMEAAVVNLHWVANGFVAPWALWSLKLPVVWTLRDMWPLTGGCHYAGSCRNYTGRCGRCPQLGSRCEHDLSRLGHFVKRRTRRGNEAIVAISRWLADCARESSIMRGLPVQVIPNSVDPDQFRPIPQSAARRSLGLDPAAKVIVFGALGAASDPRKGAALLAAALETGGVPPANLLVFGAGHDPALARACGDRVTFLGRVDDDERLAHIYAAGDVFVAPSVQEAFGKTLTEAMACGVPAIAFAGTGPDDIITHQEDGYLAASVDVEDLARGLRWGLDHPDPGRLRAAARAKVLREFTPSRVARRYIELYRQLSSERPSPD